MGGEVAWRRMFERRRHGDEPERQKVTQHATLAPEPPPGGRPKIRAPMSLRQIETFAAMTLTRRQLLANGFAGAIWSFAPGMVNSATAAPFTSLRAGVDGGRLGYNGASPGPLIRVRAGGRLSLKLVNGLAEPTSLAFPGLRALNAAVELGKPSVAPGASLDIAFAPPHSGFNVYGALIGPDPSRQFSRGLFGPIVVDEASPPAVDLEAIALFSDAPGGENFVANGAPAPARFAAPPGGRIRLRLANCATARPITLAFAGARPIVVAVDGAPSEPFEPRHDELPVGPGARFELIFDLTRDGSARVLSQSEELVAFAAAGAPAPSRPEIDGLPADPRLPREIALERSRRVMLKIAGGATPKFEGAPAAGPAFSVRRGEPVTLELANATNAPQTIRLTGHVARLLHDLDDGWEPYWRDIFVIPPGKTIHAAFVADNLGLWPIESTDPDARTAGLTTSFQVG